MVPDAARTDGVQRWDDWLTRQLAPHEVLRESSWTPHRTGITWRVRFPDGVGARIHVSPEALILNPGDFVAATSRILVRGLLEKLGASDGGVLLIRDAHRMNVVD